MTPRRDTSPEPTGGTLRAGLAWMLTWCGLLVLAAWTAGRLVNDRLPMSQYLWWIPSLVAVVTAGVCMGVAAALRPKSRRQWGPRFVLACGFVGAAAWMMLVEWNLARSPAPMSSAAQRVLFWNMAAKESRDGAAFLRAQDADLVVLANPPYAATRGELEAALAPDYSIVDLPECLIAWRGVVREQGWKSLGLKQLRPGMSVKTMGPAAIDNGWAAWVRLGDESGREVVVWVIDLPAAPGMSRQFMLRRAAAELESDPEAFPEADIIVGDFNTPRGSRSLRQVTGDMKEAFAAAGRGAGASWPRRWPLLAIDQVFLSPRFEAKRAWVRDPGPGGTHRALVTDFESR